MSMYLYHWSAISGDSLRTEIHDGTTERNLPIASNDDYQEFKKYLRDHLELKVRYFNITSLSLLFSPTHNGGESDG